jgi:hypothetical protein
VQDCSGNKTRTRRLVLAVVQHSYERNHELPSRSRRHLANNRIFLRLAFWLYFRLLDNTHGFDSTFFGISSTIFCNIQVSSIDIIAFYSISEEILCDETCCTIGSNKRVRSGTKRQFIGCFLLSCPRSSVLLCTTTVCGPTGHADSKDEFPTSPSYHLLYDFMGYESFDFGCSNLEQ